ncbi:MAG: hypothetical protein WBK55_05125 [Alphaproteobacteria bacterium]
MSKETQALDRWEGQKLRAAKEEFLREKLYSVHLYLSKTLLTLSSTTLVFSVGFKAYIKEDFLYHLSLLVIGWGFLLLCIILQMFMIGAALKYYYGCYNNQLLGQVQHTEEILKWENQVPFYNRLSFAAWLIGVCLILTFVYINLIL